MCARKGNNYRGNNINLKYSTLCCKDFLIRQIEIVKPQIVLTLGYYPLYALANIYGFAIKDNLSTTIENMPIIKVGRIIIIPLYHPVTQISKEKQIEQYNRIWKYI